jgi:peroxin-6
LVYEKLDDPYSALPANPILLSPFLHRCLGLHAVSGEVLLDPTPFGARQPTLPTAKAMTLARIATAEGVDKRYERSWLRGLRRHFTSKDGIKRQLADPEEKEGRLVRRGDVIAVPIWRDRPVSDSVDETDSDCSDTDDDASSRRQLHIPTTVGYFIVTSLSFEPLVPIEEDFRSSVSSKSRAGEFGCWVDVGIDGTTKMVLTGLERTRIASRQGEKDWHGIPRSPTPFSIPASTRLRDLLRSCFSRNPSVVMQLSILLKGSNGAGKTCMLGSIADELGYSVVTVRLPCTMIVCS